MISTEHTFTSWDGAALFYRAWLPAAATPAKRALLLFHRGHEHSGRWQETVDALAFDDVAIFAWDARGHGRSPGERGSAENLSAVIKDADAFARHVSAAHAIALEDTVVLAHSVGAVVAAAWVHDFAPPIRGMILATPAFRVKLYVPFAVPALRLKQKFFGHGYVKSYVKAKMLTHDGAQAAAYDADPLIFRQIAVNVLLDLHDAGTRLMADAGAIHTPTLVLTAGADWVVKPRAALRFLEGLSSPIRESEHFPGMSHALFHETDRAKVVEHCRRFIEACFARPVHAASLLDADKRGYTQDEFFRLQQPGAWHFAFTRLILRTFGRLSHGIALGWRTGFDSGQSLDAVYENKPQGITPLGRMIDRAYLNAIGWRGIRIRRANLERLLRGLIEKLHAEHERVHILDIAAGAGRYVLETMHALRAIPVSALLRDYKEENLAAAHRRADELGLENVTVAHADAFDRASYAGLEPRPTIGIVSGLHELIPDNDRVRRSLLGLADAIPPRGYLIYTAQPWHPQVEFIARVLRNREGLPWIMRRRTQAEMDELVRVAGFTKVAMEIDPFGIFTVSVAQRTAAVAPRENPTTRAATPASASTR